jgi:hypothetical protein
MMAFSKMLMAIGFVSAVSAIQTDLVGEVPFEKKIGCIEN